MWPLTLNLGITINIFWSTFLSLEVLVWYLVSIHRQVPFHILKFVRPPMTFDLELNGNINFCWSTSKFNKNSLEVLVQYLVMVCQFISGIRPCHTHIDPFDLWTLTLNLGATLKVQLRVSGSRMQRCEYMHQNCI